MSTNLTNVYAYLRKTFQDVDMLFAKPVSYVKHLVDAEKVIFIYKENRTNIRSPRVGEFGVFKQENSPSLNLTGSPLKDDEDICDLINTSIAAKVSFSKPWNENEEIYTPIDISLAREIITNVKDQRFSNDTRGWIVVLCNDQSSSLKNSTFLLSACLESDKNIRGIGTYHGIIKNENKSMKNLLNRHFSFIPENTKLNAQLESVFEITPDVSLKFINNNSAPSFAHIDESSEVILKQRIEIGKCHILCENFWSQIQLLNMIKLDIMNVKNNSYDGTTMDPPYNYGQSDMTFENLQEKVNRILSEVNTIEEETEGCADTGLEAVIKRARNRSLSEISDQLWDLLKYTNSYGDLKKIITFIFQISSRSNIVNIPTNNNRLSELVRELSQQRLAIPHLVGTEPLELLLEIGIEKLMKDYEFILGEGRICKLTEMQFGSGTQAKTDNRLSVRKSLSAAAVDLNSSRKTLLKMGGSNDSNLDDELGVKNSRFVAREVESNIAKLAKLHLIVEHLLLIQNNLTTENEYATMIKSLFTMSPISFDDLQYQKYDKFEISLHDKKVRHLVENLVPNSQKVVLHSENKFKKIENIFHFNIEQIVPALEQKEKEAEVNDKSGDSFHFISHTTITSKF